MDRQAAGLVPLPPNQQNGAADGHSGYNVARWPRLLSGFVRPPKGFRGVS